MARINNLTNFLTDVASAIKTKTGDSTAIPASQFDTKIANITTGHLDNTEYTDANNDLDDILENSQLPSGTINITANGEYDVTNYVEANVNISTNYFKSVGAGSTTRNGISSAILHLPSDLVLNNNCTRAFWNCLNLLDFPLINTSNVTNMDRCFLSCNNLKDLPVLNTNNVTDFTQTFSGCNSLTNESLNNIMQMCIGATSYVGTKTLRQLGISSAQATTCQSLSNYQAFLDAGWTTGY